MAGSPVTPVLAFQEATALVLHTLTSPVWMLQTVALSHAILLQLTSHTPQVRSPLWFFVEGTCSHSRSTHAKRQSQKQRTCPAAAAAACLVSCV
jgi:hypothetical protein